MFDVTAPPQKKATRYGFGEGLVAAGEKDPRVVVLGSDITGSVMTSMFRDRFPDRFFSLGIAEQNATTVAVGLALTGYVPFMSTYGVFASARNLDQLRVSVCYNEANVKIGGGHAGISVGPDGATHQALEEIAVTRVLPHMTVIVPCDAVEMKKATIAAAEEITGPVYLRFGREAVPLYTNESTPFKVGRAEVFREGSDVSIIACGAMVWEALVAAEELSKDEIDARVINLHTIKPIDRDAIILAARETGAIVTAEEHQIHGGLGGAVAEVVVRGHPVPMEFVAVNDRFGESGDPDELMRAFGLTHREIIAAVKRVLARRGS
ncbi:MAG: transketolase [Ignavibacteriales bacterium CG07_land_8_20_14_0_80_59_12]|nr:MAG: transketolase [Ignavibacteriales bacterium CG07_land_8_20_14_0_80_59_12]